MPRPVSLETRVARALRDDVLTKAEVLDLAPAVKLDGYTEKMTPHAYDVFSAYQAEAAAPGGGRALDVLAGRVPVKVSMPKWYPASYDLARAAREVKAMLLEQEEPPASIGPGLADHVVFTDADLTLIKSTTPVMVKRKSDGELLRHPDTGRLVLLGIGPTRDWKDEFAELSKAHPQIDWSAYGPEFSEFSSLSDILRSPEIREAMTALRASDLNPQSRDFVITARSAKSVEAFLDEYLAIRGVDINGVFPVSSPELIRRLDLGDRLLDAPRRKAITMAAILTLYETIKSVDYRDDSDENLIAAMQLLPRMFPGIDFRFYDVFNEDGRDVFDHRLIAQSNDGGELVDAHGQPLSWAKIAKYSSVDRYPIDPIFA